MTAGKIVMIVLDGVGDRPCPELNGLTPLQDAETPVLDRLAREGICGIMDTIAPGVRPGSDTSHLSLLGYPPDRYYTGRGPLEAEGSGIHMEPGMIGLRANFATIDSSGIVTDRRAGRIHDTALLSAAIESGVDLSPSGVTFRFASGAGHRAALALKGDNLGCNVTSNDPKSEGERIKAISATTDRQEDARTAEVLSDFVRQAEGILADHAVNRERVRAGLPPATTVLLRGAGVMGHFDPFPVRYGLRGAVISAAALISGIGRAVGLDYIHVPGITGSVNTNLNAKITAAIEATKTHDFVLVNIKGADEAGHDGHPLEKRDFIKKIDASLIPFLTIPGCVTVICGDHSTPCAVKDHSADPVPLLIHGEGVRIDGVVAYNEIACAQGGLCRISGSSLLGIACDLINRAKKYGA